VLTLVDDCTRESPAIEVDFSLPGERVVRLLDRVAAQRGYPGRFPENGSARTCRMRALMV
jgi:transposase InsO family protein